MIPKVTAVIPARMESSRFPGKPLAEIDGHPLIEHIWKELKKAKHVNRVVVASDSEEILKAVENFGGETVRTSKRHKTGSDRTAEAAEKLGGGIVVNVQADCLGLGAKDYDRVLYAMLNDSAIKYATLVKRIEDQSVLHDPNRVKVVIGPEKHALWFSRQPIPYLMGKTKKEAAEYPYYYHIGVYFFRRAALLEYRSWGRTQLEKAESLEQLRILENGKKIRVFKTKSKLYSVDSPEDLRALKNVKF